MRLDLEEIDLRILKAITTDLPIALNFISSYDSLFIGESSDLGNAVTEYIKSFKALPTARVLTDRFSNDEDFCHQINHVFGQLKDLEFNKNEYEYDLEKFKKKYVEAQLSEIKDKFTYDFDDSDLDLTLTTLESNLKKINKIKHNLGQAYLQLPIRHYINDFKKNYIDKVKNPELNCGIKTGYSYYDWATGGINESELHLVAGETGAGKSQFLNNIAAQVWLQQNTVLTPPDQFTKGYNVLYFSLEMPYEDCFRRTMSRLSDVPIFGLRDATLNKNELDTVNLTANFIQKYPYEFEIVDIPRNTTIEQIESHYLEAQSKFPVDLVVVDYMGIMECNTPMDSDWLKLGEIAASLHSFARFYKTRVMTAVQLNRLPNNKKLGPEDIIGLHRLGRSSLIATHCNVITQIETRFDEQLRSDFIYHIIKNRGGERGSATITKNFANSCIFDVPYIPRNQDELGSLIPGFELPEDISFDIAEILGMKNNQ